ncbi:MAG TPA: integrase [Nostocaceae cyanobacterium]|nr:integrase [Nostocaceae cyanobacterium]
MAKITVDDVNGRLKAANIGVTVVVRGGKISLRATFPPKPGSGKTEWYQQRLALGIYANPAGLQEAEAKAKEIGGLLAQEKFDWRNYIEVKEEEEKTDLEMWIERYEADYYARKGKTPTTINTWKSDYLPAWKLLKDRELTKEDLISAVSEVPANSRKRKLVCEKLENLAKFAGLTVDLSPYIGNYSFDKATPRYIPSDKEIEATRELLSDNPAWQWAFGVMATYGLRPHEVFFCRISPQSPHILEVADGKTGTRKVYPYHHYWAVNWQLYRINKPPVTGKTFKDYGQRVSKFFARRKIKFTPYCLRHSWCIRLSSEYKIPVTVAADWAGHEPGIFMKIYNKWITDAQERKVFEESIRRIYE